MTKGRLNELKNSENGIKFYEMFSNIELCVPNDKYYKTHLFDKNELNAKFKEYLYNVNNVSNAEDFILKFGKGWTLKIVPGEGDYNQELKDKIFVLY